MVEGNQGNIHIESEHYSYKIPASKQDLVQQAQRYVIKQEDMHVHRENLNNALLRAYKALDNEEAPQREKDGLEKLYDQADQVYAQKQQVLDEDENGEEIELYRDDSSFSLDR